MPIDQIQQQDDYNHHATYDWYNGNYDNSWYNHNLETQQQPAIMNTAHQQAPSTTGQQQPTKFQVQTVQEEANVLMVGNTFQNSTVVITVKDVLLLPPTPEEIGNNNTQQLPIAPTTCKTTTPYISVDVDYILNDSGAATHVCPKDYATQLPLESLGASTPQLFTATDDPIKVYGIRRVQYKCQGQSIVIPYFACDVKYPIISMSRLIDRGYDLYCAIAGTILPGPTLQVTLKRDTQHGLATDNWYTVMALQATKNDGKETTNMPFVSLEKQFSTEYQQSNSSKETYSTTAKLLCVGVDDSHLLALQKESSEQGRLGDYNRTKMTNSS